MRSQLGSQVLGVVGSLLIICGTVGGVFVTYLEISTGHGMDTFTNWDGQAMTWASAAGSIIAGTLTLGGSLLLWWWHLYRRSRQEGISMKDLSAEIARKRNG